MRQEARLIQVRLAGRLRQPQAYVSKIEVAERRVDVLEWLALCRACRVSPAEFLERLPAVSAQPDVNTAESGKDG